MSLSKAIMYWLSIAGFGVACFFFLTGSVDKSLFYMLFAIYLTLERRGMYECNEKT